MNKLMTKKFLGSLIVSLLILTGMSFAQNNYTVSLKNGVQVDDKTFEFDVDIVANSGGSFTLDSYQGALSFNKDITNGGKLSFSYIDGTSELKNLPNVGVQVTNADAIMELAFASSAGSDVISTTELKIGRFSIQNSKSFGNVSLNLAWNFDGSVNTIFVEKVEALTASSTDITDQINFVNLDYNTPLPVELTTFNGSLNGKDVQLDWATATELNNFGFEIQRTVVSDKANDEKWEKIGFVEGQGTSNSPKSYSFTDKNVSQKGKVAYRLKQLDSDGSFKYSDKVELDLVPVKYELGQNYPNPFNPSTQIKYSLPFESNVKITIYNMIGEVVTQLVNKVEGAGSYSLTFNASNIASGAYIYAIEANAVDGSKSFKSVKKMMLMK